MRDHRVTDAGELHRGAARHAGPRHGKSRRVSHAGGPSGFCALSGFRGAGATLGLGAALVVQESRQKRPLIRPSATFSPQAGRRMRAVKSPCEERPLIRPAVPLSRLRGEGKQQDAALPFSLRSGEKVAEEPAPYSIWGSAQRRMMGCERSDPLRHPSDKATARAPLIRPRIRYGAGSSTTFSPPRGATEFRYASLTRVVAKRVPRQRSSTGTHLQPSWTKLGLRTTVPMWSPWLFTWIRQAAAAAPTTRAVSRSARKDRVNACERMLANCAQGHKLA